MYFHVKNLQRNYFKCVCKHLKSFKLSNIKLLNDKIKTLLFKRQFKSLNGFLKFDFNLWAIFNTPDHLKQLLTFVSVS